MKKTIGLISANYTNENLGALVKRRTFASLPFGGRYRLLDFPLSNMVNSGIHTVGLVTPYNYRSIVDHVGTGKPWQLDRKVGGLFLLPGSVFGVRSFANKFLQQDLLHNRRFLDRDTADYVLCCGSSKVFNMDFRPLIEQHEKNAYPVTFVCKRVERGEEHQGLFLTLSGEQVTDMRYKAEGPANLFLDCFIADREFLISCLRWFEALSYMDFVEILMDHLENIGADAYLFDGYVGDINSTQDYMKVNMDLLDREIRRELFDSPNQIYTKVQDDAPAIYRPTARVKNSLIASGSIIEGEVENSIIFRSVHVEKGAKIKNAIIMQHAQIGRDVRIQNAVLDKYTVISSGVQIEGGRERPFIVGKNQKL